MLNSVTAAQHPHTISTAVGKQRRLGILLPMQSYVDMSINTASLSQTIIFEDLERLYTMYAERDLQNMGVIIDTNHANSGKNHLMQIRICKEVLYNRRQSKDIERLVKGFMIESYIEDGNQKIGEGCYGKSITDPCLGWEKTEQLILDMAEQL